MLWPLRFEIKVGQPVLYTTEDNATLPSPPEKLGIVTRIIDTVKFHKHGILVSLHDKPHQGRVRHTAIRRAKPYDYARVGGKIVEGHWVFREANGESPHSTGGEVVDALPEEFRADWSKIRYDPELIVKLADQGKVPGKVGVGAPSKWLSYHLWAIVPDCDEVVEYILFSSRMEEERIVAEIARGVEKAYDVGQAKAMYGNLRDLVGRWQEMTEQERANQPWSSLVLLMMKRELRVLFDDAASPV